MMTTMISDETDKDNDVNGTVVQDSGASSGRVTTRQYVPGRHPETGCGKLSMPSKHHHRQHIYSPIIHQTSKFRFGTINLQTSKDEVKLAEYILHVKNIKHDVCLFQETHMTGQGEIEFEDPVLKGWRFIYSGFKKKARAGVGIALAPHVKLEDTIHVEAGRIIGVRVIVNGIKLSIFSCYSPCDTKSYSDQTKDAFYKILGAATIKVKTEHPSFKLIVGGDFNATIGNDCEHNQWEGVGRNHDPDPTSPNGTRLLNFSKEQNLFVMNSFYGYKDIHRWTFYSNLGYKRRLDYMLCEGFVKRFTTNCRVYRGCSDGFDSDHRVLVLDCSFPSKKQRKRIFKQKIVVQRPNIQCLRRNQDIAKQYSAALDIELDGYNELDNVDDLSDKITQSIQVASDSVIPKREKSKDHKPWVDDNFLQLVNRRNACKIKSERLALNKELKQTRDKIKNEYFRKKAEAINNASEARNIEEEFRLARDHSSLNKSKKLVIEPSKLKDHFAKHFDARNVQCQPEIENPHLFPHILPPDNISVNEAIPTESEVISVIKSQKDNKCQGIDNTYAEHFKYASSTKLTAAILLLMTIIWTMVVVPKTWLSAAITCLHKKGLKSVAKNYRSIFILNTLSRLLPRIIIERLRNIYESIIMKNQFGFRKNRSTTDAIFIVREAIRSTKNPLHLCMIDLRAAYDHIDRDMLFSVIKIRTKSPILTLILKSLYSGTIAAIKHTTDYFQVQTGCRQGGIESPVLFNIYMDFVLRCAEHEVLLHFPHTGLKYSYRIKSESSNREQRSVNSLAGEDRLRMLLYADDIVLFCEDINELQSILKIYDETFSRFGLTIAIDKTKTISFNVTEEVMASKSLITLKGEPIENVRQFKYLGHMLSNESSSNSPAFIHHQIASAYSKWNELKSILLDKRIFLTTRVRFLEACVRSRLLYSVQAWQLNARELQKIEVVWNGFLRRMVKGGFARKNAPKNKKDTSIPAEEVDWSFKLSNEKVREITKTTEISHFCQIQHLKYIAHVTRLGNDSLQKQFLFCNSSKPSQRWSKFCNMCSVDESQLRRTMFNRKDFQRLLSHVT